MNEELTPKELAAIKREARSKRIRNIRRRVLVLGATLAAVFSGIVLARTAFDLNPAGASSNADLVQRAPTSTDGESDSEDEDHDEGESDEGFDGEDLGGAIVSVATGFLSDSGESSSVKSSSSAPLTTSQS
ncbi:MAG: hypothetical protein ACSLFI_11980 [Solirubrobacterales bacterium]